MFTYIAQGNMVPTFVQDAPQLSLEPHMLGNVKDGSMALAAADQ